ncbi:agouti-signaling protein 2b isoform X2 [Xiphophorus hellerii]|uniref:agouti-signaling protein 2b isoform X2 n=1 Tax=Xiphophorus hellerii TaxID=8084 RepID=UPI0013B36F29|nr:uncharacterized protein LOC116721634 isoform X2 [Xiphophorus hellerii]
MLQFGDKLKQDDYLRGIRFLQQSRFTLPEVLSLFQHATLSPSLPFQRHKSHILTPARRCGRLMENCSSHLPCCDPCASCRCRLFNTICHCWRMNPLCLKRT